MKIKIIVLLLVPLFYLHSCKSKNRVSVSNEAYADNSSNKNESITTLYENALISESDSIYRIPEILGDYPGGNVKGNEFFKKNFNTNLKIEKGMVVLKFVIEKDSTASNISIAKSVNSELDNEAIRLIKLAKWIPGKVDGKIVRSEYAYAMKIPSKNE